MIHGRYTTYNNHACRCEPCTDAHRERQRAIRLQYCESEPPEHGTDNGYVNYSCRCEPCKAAHRLAGIAQRAKRKSRPVPADAHGSVGGYLTYYCRCDECRAEYSRYQRERYARRIAARWLRVEEPQNGAANEAQRPQEAS